MNKTEQKIKDRLDEYMGFDSSLLFKETDFLTIYGGAIRDALVGDDINDIDIMALPESKRKAIDIITSFGYKQTNHQKKNLVKIYSGIRFIFEPTTFLNDKGSFIQFIKPNTFEIMKTIDPDEYDSPISFRKQNNANTQILAFITLLNNVDLTPSGLCWYNNRLYEVVKNAFIHCKMKYYKKILHSLLYDDSRSIDRSMTLEERGWKNIAFENDFDLKFKKAQRAIKIEMINNGESCLYRNFNSLKNEMGDKSRELISAKRIF